MKTFFLRLFFAICSFECVAQAKYQNLLLIENDAATPTDKQCITIYRFKNGKFLQKDTLLKSAIKPGHSGGKHLIYQDRYLIYQYGVVYDLNERKYLLNIDGVFVDSVGDTLVFSDKRQEYVGLNLKSGSLTQIGKDGWYKPKRGNFSPDHKHFLTIDYSDIPYKIRLHDATGKVTVVVPNAGNGPALRGGTRFPTVQTFWLNNNTFLYEVNFRKKNKDNTWYNKVDFRTYDIDSYQDQYFAALDSVPSGYIVGSVSKSPTDELIYTASDWSSYLVDTATKKIVPYEVHQLGNLFSMRYDYKEGNSYRYKDKVIGKFLGAGGFVSDNVIATGGWGNEGKRLLKKLKVWTVETDKWHTFEMPGWFYFIAWQNQN